jgi:hypothetical protein
MPGESARRNGRKGGRPKGSKSPQTLDKLAAREFVRQFVTANLQPLLEAQAAHAQGLKYLVTRDKHSGKFVKVTEAMAGSLKGDELVEVWEKDPSTQAFTDLLNRALDKPAEQEQSVKVDGTLTVQWKGQRP